MEHELLTLEFGRGAVAYEGRTAPAGTLGCEALNIPDAVIAALNEPCAVLNEFIAALGMMGVTDALLEKASGAALQIFNTMREMEPFSHLDQAFYAPGIVDAFTPEAIEQVRSTWPCSQEALRRHRNRVCARARCSARSRRS